MSWPLTLPAWDDLRFPAQAINPAGSPAPATADPNTGMLSFAGNADNVVAGVGQIPHSWKHGSDLHPHIHLVFPTANAGKNTRWKLEYQIWPLGGVAAANYGTYTALTVLTVPNANNVRSHILAEFDPIPMTGQLGSTCVMWKLSRLAATDVADDDTNACILLELDFHYQMDKLGSPVEIPV